MQNEKVNFNGFCDFYVASGFKTPEKPYFFIQEYKPSQNGGDPEPQLVAELISAIEINDWKEIKGCLIVGAIWNFVILEKLGILILNNRNAKMPIIPTIIKEAIPNQS